MKTLFARSFAAFFVSLVLLVLIILAVFLFGIRRSIGDWNMYRRQSLQNILVQSLNEVARREGGLAPDAVERELSQFLNPNQFVYVFDTERRPVFLYHGGERRPIEDSAVFEELDAMPAAIFDDDVIIGFLAADTLGFMSDVANLRFLRSLTVTLLTAVVLAALVAFVPAYSISRSISNSVRNLAAGLTAVAEGRRDVRFRRRATAVELALVAETAENLQAQLEHEERLRRQWAQDIAHDLRTPLSAVHTQLEGMIEGVIQPSSARLEALFQELLQVEHLVRDLRELSHIESPEMTIEPGEINSRSFLGLLLQREQAVTPRTDIEYTSTAQLDSFYGDEELLLRAVGNVLHNAATHVSPAGRVLLSVGPGEQTGSTCIEVRNTGSIADDELARVFERLYRGRTLGTGGSGLGLSITKAVVELHEGTVEMLQDNHETVVVIQLPGLVSH